MSEQEPSKSKDQATESSSAEHKAELEALKPVTSESVKALQEKAVELGSTGGAFESESGIIVNPPRPYQSPSDRNYREPEMPAPDQVNIVNFRLDFDKHKDLGFDALDAFAGLPSLDKLKADYSSRYKEEAMPRAIRDRGDLAVSRFQLLLLGLTESRNSSMPGPRISWDMSAGVEGGVPMTEGDAQFFIQLLDGMKPAQRSQAA